MREKLIELQKYCCKVDKPCPDDCFACMADHLIANGVTIPVRCKDCKHFVQGEPYDPCECMKWRGKFGVTYTTPDGYCHKGERKDDG